MILHTNTNTMDEIGMIRLFRLSLQSIKPYKFYLRQSNQNHQEWFQHNLHDI